MQRIGLFCAAFAVAALARPVAAQQAMPEQQAMAEAQPKQTEPPPFPPFAPEHHAVRSKQQATPHEHYPGTEHQRTTHHTTSKHRSTSNHHATSRHNSTSGHHTTSKHHTKSKHHATSPHRATHEHHKAPHLSERTIRQCHSMSYKQIMKYPNCRALMMSDLEAHEHSSRSSHHTASHHTTSHHSAKHHTTSTKKKHHSR